MSWFKKTLPVRGVYMPYGPEFYIDDPKMDVDLSDGPNEMLYQQATLEEITNWITATEFAKFPMDVSTEHLHELPNVIFMLNFRSLTSAEALDSLIAALEDTDVDFGMERIFALYLRLVTLMDSGYITRAINRLYYGLEVTSPPGDQTWPEIHRAHPYLWVIWFIQLTLQQLNRHK